MICYLPTGDLRDQKSSYKRAELLVVTKCDPDLNENERSRIIEEINPLAASTYFFYIQSIRRTLSYNAASPGADYFFRWKSYW